MALMQLKKALFLHKMVLLLLLEMTDNSAVAVTKKCIAPAWDGAFAADRDGWQ
jgi:hypothetical protein